MKPEQKREFEKAILEAFSHQTAGYVVIQGICPECNKLIKLTMIFRG